GGCRKAMGIIPRAGVRSRRRPRVRLHRAPMTAKNDGFGNADFGSLSFAMTTIGAGMLNTFITIRSSTGMQYDRRIGRGRALHDSSNEDGMRHRGVRASRK